MKLAINVDQYDRLHPHLRATVDLWLRLECMVNRHLTSVEVTGEGVVKVERLLPWQLGFPLYVTELAYVTVAPPWLMW